MGPACLLESPAALDRARILDGLLAPDPGPLFRAADAVRLRVKGSGVFLRGIIEFSSHCVRNCLYCGLRRANTRAARYRLDPDTVVRLAVGIAARGIGTVVLQSGDDLDYPAAEIARMVRGIKRRADMAVVLSVGEREPREYALWREAGVDRYLMKHETSDPRLYALLHPGRTLAQRLSALRTLKSLDYEIGTGFIVGLPGQTPEILAEDVLLARELGADMCGVGPFVPQSRTPLAKEPPGSPERTLRVVALLRLASPGLNLPATTALATLDPVAGQTRALRAGANVIMPSFTPTEARAKYRIYDNKADVDLAAALDAATAAGRCVVRDGKVRIG
ncbi:[FeFe] hydrogenase H-cluster radical SAM maturase HydE [Desulfovibrio aminophilus]|uniref:[FeFe] hydrogenase H-cluster radical SAM maturase HydE n=1 Tax=Desulfovibrio aminophilus TaxID=81425 RepID=UPI0033964A3B